MSNASYRVHPDYFCFGLAEKFVIQITEEFLLWKRIFLVLISHLNICGYLHAVSLQQPVTHLKQIFNLG